MQKNKLFAAIIVGFVATSAALYFSRHKPAQAPTSKQGEPQQNVEEILAERARQASKQLETPLGKALVAKDWAQVQTLYKPESEFIQLGEIIRALYLENKMKEYTPEDQEKLLALVISTFDGMPEKNLHLSGMLISQFERLPSPKHTSANFKTLKTWIHNPKEAPLKRRLGLIKLAVHDANPDEEAANAFKKIIISGDILGESRSDWIQKIDEVRNHALMLASAELLSKNFKKIADVSQPAALFVLSHHLEVKPDETKKLTLQFLDSEEQGRFEAALRSLPTLIRDNHLKEAEKSEIVKKLTNLPTPLKTPFVEMKAKEILNLLGHT